MTDAEPTPVNLTRFERLALGCGRFANERSLPKRFQRAFLRTVSYRWVAKVLERRTLVENADYLIQPPSDRGVLTACNHRSFFDAYVYMTSLLGAGAAWPKNIYFPVRSNFIYERPGGMLVNFAIGGGSMYPPIFRDRSKSELNDDALRRIVHFLQQPESLVGIHPEGTRNKGDDPYTLLPAQPGIGRIVLNAKPVVIPVFVNGVNNDFVGTVRDGFRGGAKRDNPCIVVFGQPVDYSEFTKSKPRAALYKRTADKICAAILECGDRERELREKCSRGEIADDDPRWLRHLLA